MEIKLTENIIRLVENKPYKINNVGLSGSAVLMYDDMVLKAEKYREHISDREVRMLKWLEGKLPVPRIIYHEVSDGISYILMSRIGGRMACDEYYLDNPGELVRLLADGLQLLWNVDISDCPCTEDMLPEMLAEIRRNIESGKIDADAARSAGFESPDKLFGWLEANKPVCTEPVFIHGDYCLPNIMLENGAVSGFIDLCDCGIGDKWYDITLCLRSLQRNLSGAYGGKVRETINPDILFDAAGIAPDYDRIRYYELIEDML